MAAQFIAPPIKQNQLKTRSPFQHSDFYTPNYSIPILGLVWASIPSDTKFSQIYCSLAVLCLLYSFLLCLERAGYTRSCKSAANISYCLALVETQCFQQITVRQRSSCTPKFLIACHVHSLFAPFTTAFIPNRALDRKCNLTHGFDSLFTSKYFEHSWTRPVL